MQTTQDASSGRNGTWDRATRGKPALLDVAAVAALLSCSKRHVCRLSDGGCMPRPLKLGSLVRWQRTAIHQWIKNGCPRVDG